VKYKEYSSYKDSGVEWLGEIPEHWGLKNVKYLLNDHIGIKIGPFGSSLKLDNMTNKGFKVYGQENVIRRNFSTGHRFISEDKFKSMIVYKMELDDILITMMGTIGKCIVVPKEHHVGIIDSHLIKIRTNELMLPSYFVMMIDKSNVVKIQLELNSKGSIMQGLNSSIIKNLLFPLPDIVEQEQILNYLDKATAKIDALIAKQTRLIALLKEKRQAVISTAVTRGLDSTVAMKDSGVEWLGDIPEHWKSIKFGLTHASATLGGNYLAGEAEEGVPVIKMGNLNRGSISLKKIEHLPKDENFSKEHILKHGDFLFNTRNSLELVGKVSIWRSELKEAVYNSNILRINFNKKFVGSTEFMNYLFNSSLGLSQLRLIAKGTTNVAAIYYKELSSLIFAIPSLEEQESITSYLDKKTISIDNLISNSTQAIALLKEKRTALISSVVTGKIDVRGMAK
jgi:type I restriction enzyme S subunit